MAKCPTCGLTPPKTNAQRNKFHSMCRELGAFIGLTAGKVKDSIKQEHSGIDEWKMGDKWYRGTKPSEQNDREEYSELIECLIQWAAENVDYVFGERV